ncbi:hypothetical protein DFJ73DRAFT_795660 [Zopfochytrium polystomum]|nr:hypothetical protein DFJ73DRAFT_795660 [Zopfochytrium polystomum]
MTDGGGVRHSRNPEPIELIDSHVHLTDLAACPVAWTAGTAYDRNYLAPDLDAATAALPSPFSSSLRGFVFVEVDAVDAAREAEFVHAYACSTEPRILGMVVGVQSLPAGPNDPRFLADLERIDRLNAVKPLIKGVRYLLQDDAQPDALCTDPAFVGAVALLGTRGLSFDFCVSFRRHPARLRCAAALARACPLTTFVLDHLGKPDVDAHPHRFAEWAAAADEIAALPNTVCKISGLVTESDAELVGEDAAAVAARFSPFVLHVIAAFGKERILFGSDWFVSTAKASYADWLALLDSIISSSHLKQPFSHADKVALFGGNAKRVYRLG